MQKRNVPGMSPFSSEDVPENVPDMSPEMSPGRDRWINEVHVPETDLYWTPKLVETRLLEAFKFAEKTAGRIGPKQYGSASPAPLWEPGDHPLPKGEFVLMLSPAEVSRLEAALGWMAHYLRDEPGATNVAEAFVRGKLARLPWKKVVKRAGWSLATADRKRERAFSIIAQGLNRDRVPVL